MTVDELQTLIDGAPYHRFLRMQVLSAEAGLGEVCLKLPFREEFSRSFDTPQVHGGITAAFIDLAGDYAVAVRLGRGVPTINLRIDYLRMAGQTALFAHARAIKIGRSIGLVDVDVTDDADRLIAVGRGNYSTAS